MKNNARFVVDTNVIVSHLLFKESKPGQAVSKAVREGTLLLSDETIKELLNVLNRKKLDKYLSAHLKKQYVTNLFKIAQKVHVTETITACRDPKDNKFLELAVNGRATCIITGDGDLLELNPFQGIPILTPDKFLQETFDTHQ